MGDGFKEQVEFLFVVLTVGVDFQLESCERKWRLQEVPQAKK